MEIVKTGIDISKWQKKIDADKIKAAGIEFVILREGSGTTLDSKFSDFAKKLKKAQIEIAGVYHFSYAENVSQARNEAALCIKNLKKAGLSNDTVVFYDFEGGTVRAAADNGVILTEKECNEFAKAFCEKVESEGYRAGIYFNISYYKHWFDHELLGKYVRWLADYSGEAECECEYRQFTSTGRVDGIDGDVDMDYRYEKVEEKSLDELAAEVLAGVYGKGTARKTNLEKAGYSYSAVQERVNQKIIDAQRKSAEDIAREVIDRLWGKGEIRKRAIEAVGKNYREVQDIVNVMIARK